MMEGRRGLDQPLRHAIEETWAVFNPETGTPDLALLLARLSDLARSNAFLWMKAGLSAQEHATRQIQPGGLSPAPWLWPAFRQILCLPIPRSENGRNGCRRW